MHTLSQGLYLWLYISLNVDRKGQHASTLDNSGDTKFVTLRQRLPGRCTLRPAACSPDAKFVYVRRDPYAVYQSKMHLRRTIHAENSLVPPDFSNSEEDMLICYEKCIRPYEETKSLIPASLLHELRFEDMERDLRGEIRKIYCTLNLDSWARLER